MRPAAPPGDLRAALSAFTFAAGVLVARQVATAIMRRTAGTPAGLLNVVPLPFPARIIAGFLLMDFTFHWWHRTDHRVRRLLALPFLRQRPYWRFPDGTPALRDRLARVPVSVMLE